MTSRPPVCFICATTKQFYLSLLLMGWAGCYWEMSTLWLYRNVNTNDYFGRPTHIWKDNIKTGPT